MILFFKKNSCFVKDKNFVKYNFSINYNLQRVMHIKYLIIIPYTNLCNIFINDNIILLIISLQKLVNRTFKLIITCQPIVRKLVVIGYQLFVN